MCQVFFFSIFGTEQFISHSTLAGIFLIYAIFDFAQVNKYEKISPYKHLLSENLSF